jgi:hypothetical protein
MLAITLDNQQQQNDSSKHRKTKLDFEIKVVNDGLFPEVRLTFQKKKSPAIRSKASENIVEEEIN